MNFLQSMVDNPRTGSRSLWLLLPLIFSVMILFWFKLTAQVEYPRDSPGYSITMNHLSAAINTKFCNTHHMIRADIQSIFESGHVTGNSRLYDLASCSKNLTFWNGEGLPSYWMDKLIINIFGNISLQTFVTLFCIMEVLPIFLFSFYLLTIGISWIYAWIITFLAVAINLSLKMPLDSYPFILPCFLCLLSFYGLSIRFGLYKNIFKHIGVLGCFAVVAFFLFYTRSSKLPEIILLVFIYLSYLYINSKNKYLSILTVVFVQLIVVVMLNYFVHYSDQFKPTKYLHPVMHPLVLGLGVPGNPFTEKLGIQWDDSIGQKLANSVSVTPPAWLSVEYNQALEKYYVLLWKEYPKDMLLTYYLKLNFTYRDIIKHSPITLLPFRFINSNVFYLWIVVVIFLSAYKFLKKPENISYLWLSISTIAFLELIEAVLIFSRYKLIYQSFFIFYLLILACAFWMFILNLLYLFFGKRIKFSSMNFFKRVKEAP